MTPSQVDHWNRRRACVCEYLNTASAPELAALLLEQPDPGSDIWRTRWAGVLMDVLETPVPPFQPQRALFAATRCEARILLLALLDDAEQDR